MYSSVITLKTPDFFVKNMKMYFFYMGIGSWVMFYLTSVNVLTCLCPVLCFVGYTPRVTSKIVFRGNQFNVAKQFRIHGNRIISESW